MKMHRIIKLVVAMLIHHGIYITEKNHASPGNESRSRNSGYYQGYVRKEECLFGMY